jgi:hypothetical protein
MREVEQKGGQGSKRCALSSFIGTIDDVQAMIARTQIDARVCEMPKGD